MTLFRFLNIFFLQLLLQTGLKTLFYRFLPFGDPYWQFLFWCAIFLIAAISVRRLGVINFLEAGFVAVFWFLSGILADVLITWPASGQLVFGHISFWIGYVVMILAAFFFHQKRHIHIRRQQQAHHGQH